MLGWEFPPFFAGGLGMVCFELTKALKNLNHEITYIMPYGPQNEINSHIKILVADRQIPGVDVKFVRTTISAYLSEKEYVNKIEQLRKTKCSAAQLYGKNLYEEVELFKERILKLAKDIDFDVIHANDWLTYPAAISLTRITNKPVVLHIHNTVFDRYPNGGGDHEQWIEKWGFSNCDKIIAVSNYTRNIVINKYHIDPQKIEVVHNANVSFSATNNFAMQKPAEKVVLFAGRMTVQKGAHYFIEAAKLILQKKKIFILLWQAMVKS